MNQPRIGVFLGGVSSEREVSLGSGAAAVAALARRFDVDVFEINTRALPLGVDAGTHVIFSTLHGVFGEDGGMQRLLEEQGFHYAGCDAASSALCFNKAETKRRVAEAGVPIVPGVIFLTDAVPAVEDLISELGESIVLKPNCQGSSVGLQVVDGAVALAAALERLDEGQWVAEKRIRGRELTVGLVQGRAMGIVEIRPKSGRFDYESKYTKGLTEYLAPAPLPDDVARRIRETAETAFRVCGCRDFARIDYMLGDDGSIHFLEINTLPGLKETSLLPMSAKCLGIEFDELLKLLVEPALQRYQETPKMPSNT